MRPEAPQSAGSDGEDLLNLLADPVVGLDGERRISYWNRAAERTYGFSAAEALGADHVELLRTRFPLPLGELLETLADTGCWQGNLVLRTKSETELTVESRWAADYDELGNLSGSIAVDRDITIRREEQAEDEFRVASSERERLQGRMRRTERLESVGQLAGGVAHDFNNLLAIIINYGALVSAELEDDSRARGDERWKLLLEDLGEIDLAATRAARLTHHLLSFSRQDIHAPAPMDVNDAISGIQEMLRRTLGEHVQLDSTLGEGLHMIRADSSQLGHALVNLAVNARDAMPRGGKLTIDTADVEVDGDYAASRPDLEPGHYVRVRVSDTGRGMAPEVVQHAFDPFFTTKPLGKGTGLGLATVYGIITRSGGHAHFYSEPGVGTTFVALFPALDVLPAGEREEPAPIVCGGATILLVEDEQALRAVTRRILEAAGYRVLVAAGGPEALAALGPDGEPVDLLLSDVVMPEMLGPELASRLRERKPSIRVLYMSGFAQPVLGQAMELGTVAMIEKPFTAPALLRRIEQALAHVQLEPQAPHGGAT